MFTGHFTGSEKTALRNRFPKAKKFEAIEYDGSATMTQVRIGKLGFTNVVVETDGDGEVTIEDIGAHFS